MLPPISVIGVTADVLTYPLNMSANSQQPKFAVGVSLQPIVVDLGVAGSNSPMPLNAQLVILSHKEKRDLT